MHFINKCSQPTRIPNPNPNLNVSKTMQASYFLRAFTLINSASPTTSSTMQRRRSIRRAAYASMARAAGNRRAWSRAVLRRLHRGLRLSTGTAGRFAIRRRIRVSRPPREAAAAGQADVLRGLVPGGKAMDFCNLLEETANYIQCLSAQVGLMQSLADSISECALK